MSGARNPKKKDTTEELPTARELEVLLKVAEKQSWSAAAEDLGLANKYVVERIIKRLAKKLDIKQGRMVRDFGDRVEVPDEFTPLLEEIESLLFTFRGIAQKIESPDARVYRLRADMYPAHVSAFAAKVLGEFERDAKKVEIDLIPSFGGRRTQQGVGMVRAILDKRTDLAIAPYDPLNAETVEPAPWPPRKGRPGKNDRPRLRMMPCHRWALVAAVNPAHKILKKVIEPNLLPLTSLDFDSNSPLDNHLMTSPPGHKTRALLDSPGAAFRKLKVVTTSSHPEALIALGAHSERIPLVASDSFLPVAHSGKWPAVGVSHPDPEPDGDAGSPGGAEPYTVLGGRYAVYWREQDQPKELVEVLRSLATSLSAAALRYEDDTLTDEWKALQWSDEAGA